MKHLILFALAISVFAAKAQVVTGTDLVAFATSNEKAEKDNLLKRGYTIDRTSGKEVKYKAGMYGEEKVMTQPLRFFEVKTDSCTQNILTFQDGTVQFYTADIFRYKQLAKELYALGFAKFAPGAEGETPVPYATGGYPEVADNSTQHPAVKLHASFPKLSNICGKQVVFYVISIGPAK